MAVGGAAWMWAEDRIAQSTPTPEAVSARVPEVAASPVLSLRRNADWFARNGRVGTFATVLQPIVDSLPADSCFVVELDGLPVTAQRATEPLVPASTMKVLVAAVALDVLGPDHTFVTRVHGQLVGDTVEGDLYVIGGGDPLLAVAEYPPTIEFSPVPATSLETLADAVVAAGVQRVTGRVIGDGSRYDDEWTVESWGDNRIVYGGPIDGLLVNDGRVLDGVTVRETIPPDPAKGAGEQFTRVLQNRRVTVSGQPDVGAANTSLAVLGEVSSAPLSVIVAEMLTTSDNNTAEMLLKEIGLAVKGAGTRANGAAAILERLTTWGVPTDGVVIVDGSGLDHGNRLTCAALVGTLRHQGATGPLHDGLAIAGTSGTLADQFAGTRLAGQMRAKTGTLSHARALTGFVPTPAGVVTFALVVNVSKDSLVVEGAKTATDVAQPVWDSLAFVFPEPPPGPSADQLAP